MIDTHCHLDAAEFDADRDAVLERAAVRGVTDIVIPAVDRPTFAPILALAARAGRVRCHAALGLHPIALPRWSDMQDPAEIAALSEIGRSSKLVAIGECGLDSTLEETAVPMARQVAVVEPQVKLAQALGLPLIFHARGGPANVTLLDILDRLGPIPGGVVHSYGGGPDHVARFVAHGLSFGFAGPATWPRARKIRNAIRAIPDDRLLAETDAPDQCPEPYRPGRSEPAYVAEVIAGIAGARERKASEIAALTTENARRVFGLRA